jgi:O-antigen/teichoic acid export membrane protein
MRSSAWTIFGYGTSQAIRLGSNLILTRLLFPEAFGLMALVGVVTIGLALFSDFGIGTSIMQNKRGDDPSFLNTAWTFQVVRGALLWLGCCILAWPVSIFYGEPLLAQFLPVAGLSLLIAGFLPTRLHTANRHLMLGRVIQVDLASQLVGTVLIIFLAWWTRSVWALVIGSLMGSAVHLALVSLLLPGARNHFAWERCASRDLFHFGKWIFLSTICGFFIAQGDKMILGKYLSAELLGIYAIGFFLGSFPVALGIAVSGRILVPLYRERPPNASPENFRRLQTMRFGMTSGLMAVLAAMAIAGVDLVALLYDPRYVAAGTVAILIVCIQLPAAVAMTYDQAAVAAGDTRSFFLVMAGRAIVQLPSLLIGAEVAGLLGALMGQGLAAIATYPLFIWIARRHGAWDPLHDILFGFAGMILATTTIWLHWDAIAALSLLQSF